VPGRSASHLGRSPVLHGTHRTPTYTQEMSNLFQTVLGFFAPKPIRTHVESMTTYRTIEAVNDCGEKRYIQIEIERNRQQDLEILLTKCKRLLSFVEKTNDLKVFEKMAHFVVKVRQAKYRGDNIQYLFHEFEEIEKDVKKSSRSSMNLSSLDSV
jgi:hypothetical protein